MKKHIHRTIRAHLIRSALYIVLLVAVCVIPFAAAQRNTTKHDAAKRTAPQLRLARFAAGGAPQVAPASTEGAGASGTQSIGQSLLPYDIPPKPRVSPAGVCTPAPWQEQAAMPVDLYGAGGASDGTFYYSAGGYSFSVPGTLAVFNRYDPATNSWTSLPDMPQSAAMPVAVYYPPTNKIYVFGGEDGDSGTNYNITRIYDIGSNTWTTGANLPDVRSFMAGGYNPGDGMIYILSGYNTGDVTSAQPNTWQYDPVADSWTDLTESDPYPHPAGGFGYGVINNRIYTAGGRDAANTIINDTWEFDPAAPAGSRYTQKTDEPGSFQNNVPGSAVAQGVLWVYGGGNPFAADAPETKAGITAPTSARVSKTSSVAAFFKNLLRRPNAPDTASDGRFYDPISDSWSNSPNMNEVRAFSSGAAIGSNLIIASGGYNGFSTVASAETENVCAGGGVTPTPTPTPTAIPSCTPVVINGAIDLSDPTQTDRLFRDGVPSTCDLPKICPGAFGDGQQHHYDSYTFTNNSGTTQCVNVDINTACTGNNSVLATAYLGSFNPLDLCENYLADEGGSPNPTEPFSFELNAGQSAVVVVAEVNADAGCPGYTMTVSGLCSGGVTPTPTVSPTATPRVTPRPRPTPHPRPTP